jgi:hypothetical protein
MLPRVQPIAPVLRVEPFDDPEWLFDLKYDGFRALCYLEQGRCRLISRNGNPMSRFARLSQQIAAALDVDDAVLDGEIIAVDETGRPRFYDLLRDTRAPAYVAFDLLWLNGTDLRSLPLIERRQRLQNYRYKPPPRRKKAVPLVMSETCLRHEVPAVVKISGKTRRRVIETPDEMKADASRRHSKPDGGEGQDNEQSDHRGSREHQEEQRLHVGSTVAKVHTS